MLKNIDFFVVLCYNGGEKFEGLLIKRKEFIP